MTSQARIAELQARIRIELAAIDLVETPNEKAMCIERAGLYADQLAALAKGEEDD